MPKKTLDRKNNKLAKTRIDLITPTREVDQPPDIRQAFDLSELIGRTSMAKTAFEAPENTIIQGNPLALERERDILTATLHAEERELALSSYWYFVSEVICQGNWMEHYTDFHRDLCDTVQNLGQGEDLWVFLQREGRKTYILDILHNIWLIARDPDIRILLIGARKETVKGFARLTRSAFMPGSPGFEKFQYLFPELMLRKTGDTNDEAGSQQQREVFQFTIPGRTKALADPTFRAAYLGVTGSGWRCDVLKFDDPVERRNVTNAQQAAKALGHMLDLIPLLHTGSKYKNLIGMGTRYSYLDPFGKVLGETTLDSELASTEMIDRLRSRKTKIIVQHAWVDPNTQCTMCPKHITELYPHGNPISPFDIRGEAPLYPIHTQETLLASLGHYQTDPALGESMWWHQYQNVCMSPDSTRFKPEWFYEMAQPGWPVFKKRILAVDSADKDFQRAGIGDYMCAIMGEYDDSGRLLCRHGLRSNKWTRDQFIQAMLAWCQATGWWPNLAVKEKFGTDTFLKDLQRAFNGVMRPLHVIPVTRPSQTSKLDFIVDTLQAPMERGEIVFGSLFPRDLLARVKYEGQNLGQVVHEDVMDTLALLMTPGVRVNIPNKPISRVDVWTPPTLNLYEPGQGPISPHPDPNINPNSIEQISKRPKVAQAIFDLGFSQDITFDPASFSVPLVYDRD